MVTHNSKSDIPLLLQTRESVTKHILEGFRFLTHKLLIRCRCKNIIIKTTFMLLVYFERQPNSYLIQCILEYSQGSYPIANPRPYRVRLLAKMTYCAPFTVCIVIRQVIGPVHPNGGPIKSLMVPQWSLDQCGPIERPNSKILLRLIKGLFCIVHWSNFEKKISNLLQRISNVGFDF